MNPVASVLLTLGVGLILLSGVGLLRLPTTYAWLHAVGKASPVGFLLLALGASTEVGAGGTAQLAVASGAMLLTLPVVVHLLFRAVHRTTPGTLRRDDLRGPEQYSTPPASDGTEPEARSERHP